MRTLFSCLTGMALLFTCATSAAQDFQKELTLVKGLGELVNAPEMQDAEGYEQSDELKAIYFDALPYKGKPTKVFAWLGIPKRDQGEKLPAVVLVHGGGGTAYKDWVKIWNDKGFAAISIAVEGQSDQRDDKKQWLPHEWPGPVRDGIYNDSDVELTDQWMYHSVADTILANSLLRSLPQVDPERVGLMGISWGGVISSTAIGIDDRFAFAISAYGCGSLATAENAYGKELGKNSLYQKVWDPMVRLSKATMPTLWISWPGDKHFPLNNQAECYRAVPVHYQVTLIPELGHGHGPPQRAPDGYAFAKSVVENGKEWCHESKVSRDGEQFEVVFASSKPASKAILVSTKDKGFTAERTWNQSDATLVQEGSDWKVTGTLPADTTAWFVNLQCDDGGDKSLTASSSFQEIDE